jgi:L-iditol 2-dehydrogenase
VRDRVRAAVSYGPREVRIEEVPLREPRPGEVVVAMDACGVCGSDLIEWYVEQKAPTVLGHEPVGRVIALGEEAPDGIELDQRVFAHHHVPCLDCDVCRRGHETRCGLFRSTDLVPGGFAEAFVVPAENAARDLHPLPADLDDETATLIEPLACCIRGQRLADVGATSRLLVVGVGQMGLLHVQAAVAAGCAQVVASDPIAERRALAERFGAAAVPPDRDAIGDALPDGPTVAVVCTYLEPAIRLALETITDGGTVQLFAPPPPGRGLEIDGGDVFFRELTVQGSYSAGPDDVRGALDLVTGGAVTADGIITHRFPLAETERALEVARTPDSVKVVVTGDGGQGA